MFVNNEKRQTNADLSEKVSECHARQYLNVPLLAKARTVRDLYQYFHRRNYFQIVVDNVVFLGFFSACNIITSFSFVALGGISAFSYLKDFRHIIVPFEVEYASLTANETDLLYFLGFFLAINLVIRVVINRYPLRIYRNEKQYFAVFEGQVPFITKSLRFQRGEVVPVPLGGILPWQESRYKINGKNVLLLDEYFKTPSELNIMLVNDKSGEE